MDWVELPDKWIGSFEIRAKVRQNWPRPFKLLTFPFFYPDAPFFAVFVALFSPYSPFNMQGWIEFWKRQLKKVTRHV